MYYTLEQNKEKKNNIIIEDFKVANLNPKGENYQSAKSSL